MDGAVGSEVGFPLGTGSRVALLDEPADEPGVQSARQLIRLLRQRPPGQVAAGDDQVRVLALDLCEDGGERGRVPVDVGDDCDLLHV